MNKKKIDKKKFIICTIIENFRMFVSGENTFVKSLKYSFLYEMKLFNKMLLHFVI